MARKNNRPLFFKLNVQKVPTKQPPENLSDLPGIYYFDEKCKTKFTETLKSTEMFEKLNSLNLIHESNTDLLASEITGTLLEVCKKSNIKPKKSKLQYYNEPWFDNECNLFKKSLKKKCRKLREIHDDKKLYFEILQDNKTLKKLVMKKKDDYKLKLMENLNLKRKEQKVFWKLLDKLQPRSKDDSPLHKIPGVMWNNHFKSILQTKNKMNIPPDSLEIGPLDYDISIEEMFDATYILKSNKATGYDSISNEMIKCLLEIYPVILVKLFNNILKTNVKIKEWETSIIIPIHKSGAKTNPSNYRGIRDIRYVVPSKIVHVNIKPQIKKIRIMKRIFFVMNNSDLERETEHLMR